jgi:hypothetical protein
VIESMTDQQKRAQFDDKIRAAAEVELVAQAAARKPAAAGAVGIKVVSDGTREGTYLADRATGARIDFDGRVSLHVHWPARKGERSTVRLVFEHVEVEAPEGTVPFEFHG